MKKRLRKKMERNIDRFYGVTMTKGDSVTGTFPLVLGRELHVDEFFRKLLA